MAPRDRDALVAEKVMGWRWQDYQWYDGTTKQVLATDGYTMTGDDFGRLGTDSERLLFWDMPDYSASISAAWEVVETMRSRQIFTDIFTFAHSYTVEMKRHEHGHEKSIAYLSALIAPEAICLAALRTVGVGV